MKLRIATVIIAASAVALSMAQQDRSYDHSSHRESNTSRNSTSNRNQSRSSSQATHSYNSSTHESRSQASSSHSTGTTFRSSLQSGNRSLGSQGSTSSWTHHEGTTRSYSDPSTTHYRTSESERTVRSDTTRTVTRRSFDEFPNIQRDYQPNRSTHGSWSDRYTGSATHESPIRTAPARVYNPVHSESLTHHTGVERGRLVVHNSFIRQSAHWGGGWRSGWDKHDHARFGFSFGFYLTDRFDAPCYVSPWYYYSALPPYIPADTCVIVPNYSCEWQEGAIYRWNSDNSYYRDSSLDDAIAEIQDANQNQNLDAVEALIPSNGDVAVSTEGQYDYSLHSDAFRNMFSDSVRGVETVSFRVDEVRKSGDGATIECAHEVREDNGNVDTIFETYRLRREGGRFVITDFMTSQSSQF